MNYFRGGKQPRALSPAEEALARRGDRDEFSRVTQDVREGIPTVLRRENGLQILVEVMFEVAVRRGSLVCR